MSSVPMNVPAVPHSMKAEESVVGQMLARHEAIPEVIDQRLATTHFYNPALRILFSTVVDAYYADDPMDPLMIATAAGKRLQMAWQCTQDEAIAKVEQLAATQVLDGGVSAHAKVVRRDHDYRALLSIAASLTAEVQEQEKPPAELAGRTAQAATEVVTATMHSSELVDFGTMGRNFIAHQQKLMAARQAGVDLGAFFGIDAIDKNTRGLLPGELFFLAGEPGVGKSAVAWRAALNFATGQARRGDDKVATLVASLEMGEESSSSRIAMGIAGLDGGRMRDGSLRDYELDTLIREWGRRKDLPLHFNFSSTVKASELRALIAEGVRRHNVGLVVVDHFRYFDMDRRSANLLEEDEEKAKFLKQSIAKELNVAVICLAHTVKMGSVDGGRPTMAHLRGSGQMSAEADFIAFVYRPWMYATQREKDSFDVVKTDAELIFAKNRFGDSGISEFTFDPSTMTVTNK